ncbi:nitrate- and nitrite sensing domain-containing protein [Hydrogenimonas sp.]
MSQITTRAKLILPIFSLIAILLTLGGITIQAYYDKIHMLDTLNEKITFGRLTSRLMHSLQKERGLSSGFSSNGDGVFKSMMQKQRKTSDALLDITIKRLQRTECQEFRKSVEPFLFDKTVLENIRHEIDTRNIDSETLIQHYSALNQELLGIILHIAESSHIPIITRDILAFAHFLAMKEYVGVERAKGVVVLSMKRFDIPNLLILSDLIAKQKENERYFLQYAPISIRNRYGQKISDPIFAEIETYELRILQGDPDMRNLTPVKWYETITKKLDIYEHIIDDIEQTTAAHIDKEMNSARKVFYILIFLVGLGLAIFTYMLKAMLKLFENEQKLRRVMDKYIISSITDTRGIITDVSDAFCKISGYTRKELIGKPHNIIRHPDMPSEAFKDLWHTIKQGKTWRGKVKNLKKDGGYYWVYANIDPLYDNKGEITAYISIRIDITEIERLQEKVEEEEKKIRRQEHMLQQQHRLAQMGEMIAMIAHQWRQPLSAITAAAGSLHLKAKIGTIDADIVLELSGKIKEFSLHLSKTIDDFRNFFKSDKIKRKTDFKTIVESVLKISESSLEKHGITIETHVKTLEPFSAYDNEIRQVILNLIKNAEDVLVERDINSAKIVIEIDGRCLRVRDNGGGIPEDIIDHVFNPYFSTKLQKDGTGLGLYMSKVIVEEHCHGTLRAYNSPEGAIFEINLNKRNER